MTCSRNKALGSRPAILLLAGLMSLGGAAHALAQEAETVRQYGPPATPTAAAPDPAVDAAIADETSRDENAPSVQKRPNSGAIVIGTLAQVDPSSVGLIDPSSGGFGTDMWAGSNRTLIERLLPLLPVVQSPALQRLNRKLLLTAAVVPEGDEGPKSLIALRLERLAAAGDLASVLDLASRLPAEFKDADMARLQVNAALLSGDVASACARMPVILQADPANAYWLQVSGYCRVAEGNMEAASLALEMFQERGVKAPLYFQLMARLMAPDSAAKNVIELKGLQEPSPLIFSMLQKAGIPLPASVATKASALMLQAIATSSAEIAPEIRLEAAARAARNGSLPAEKLAELYGAVVFTPEEAAHDTALGDADMVGNIRGPRADALLYQAALASEDINSRGPVIQAIWKRAKRLGALALQAQVNAPVISSIEPSPEALPYAGEIVRMLLLAGQFQRVAAWDNFIRTMATPENAPQNTPENTEAAAFALSLWPLMTAADVQGAKSHNPKGLDVWWQAEQDRNASDGNSRRLLLVTTLSGLGYKIPDAAWIDLIGTPPPKEAAQPALLYGRYLGQAAKAKRLGEMALLSLISFGDGGPQKTHPVILGSALSALEAAGLDEDARAIAIEALILRGF